MEDQYIYPDKFFRKDNNKKKRNNWGQFYTPYPVVDYINRGVENILSEIFEIEDGFASNQIKLLDFAAGTGIFICDAIERAFKSNKDLDEIYKIIQDNYYAFEIDKENYDILIENIGEIFNRYGYEFNFKNIHNINTLTKEAYDLF